MTPSACVPCGDGNAYWPYLLLGMLILSSAALYLVYRAATHEQEPMRKVKCVCIEPEVGDEKGEECALSPSHLDEYDDHLLAAQDKLQVERSDDHSEHCSKKDLKKTESKLDLGVGIEMITLNDAKALGGGADMSDFDMDKSEKKQRIHKVQKEIQSKSGMNVQIGALQETVAAASNVDGAATDRVLLLFHQVLKIFRSKGKILVGYLQVVSPFQGLFEVPWPQEFIDYMNSLAFINLGLFEMFTLDCIDHSTTFYTTLVIAVTAPIVLSVLNYVAYLIRLHQNPGEQAASKIKSQHIKLFCIGLFLVYTGTSTTIVETFKCRPIGDEWRLEADMALVCFDEKWVWGACLAIAGFFLYSIGIPIFFMVVLLRHRDVLHLDIATPEQELADAKNRLKKLNRMSDAVHIVRSLALLNEIAAAGDAVDAKQGVLNRVTQQAARHQHVKA